MTECPQNSQSLNQSIEPQIQGAIYRFAAWLATREGTLTIGAKHNFMPMVDAVNQFIISEGLNENCEVDRYWKLHLFPGMSEADTQQC